MFYLLDVRFILIYDVNIGFFSRLVNWIHSGFLFQLTDTALEELTRLSFYSLLFRHAYNIVKCRSFVNKK